MSTNTLYAIFFVCALILSCVRMWLDHEQYMNGPCRDCSECVERWQDNLNVEKE